MIAKVILFDLWFKNMEIEKIKIHYIYIYIFFFYMYKNVHQRHQPSYIYIKLLGFDEDIRFFSFWLEILLFLAEIHWSDWWKFWSVIGKESCDRFTLSKPLAWMLLKCFFGFWCVSAQILVEAWGFWFLDLHLVWTFWMNLGSLIEFRILVLYISVRSQDLDW